MSMFRSFSKRTRKPETQVHHTYRSPEVFAAYDNHMKRTAASASSICSLCDNARVIVRDYGAVRVIKNDFPYAVFEELPVQEHLMVVSARHVSDLGDLTNDEAVAYWRVCAEYNDNSYTMLTQAATKSQRSVPGHIHTHLLLCNDQK